MGKTCRSEIDQFSSFANGIANPILAIAHWSSVKQIADMEIAIIFDTAFHGRAAGAVWIVKSDQNRQWFENQPDLDAGSAIFTPEDGEIGRAAIFRSIWNVQEHYPDWSRISVNGVAITHELSSELRDEGKVIKTKKGFVLVRT